jgi:hypothetical protein
MTCPICFFRDSFQRKLKLECFGIERFEDKLRAYKAIFISGVSKLQPLQQCDCGTTYSDKRLAQWVDSFREALVASIGEFDRSFDDLIAVYESFIRENQKVATDLLWRYVEEHNLLNFEDSWLSSNRLLFRARQTGEFDRSDARQYFHIPFAMRHLVANQRFSVSGQPMLYFGSSVLAVSKELEQGMDSLLVAAFVPKYSSFFGKKIFSLRNKIHDTLENSLPGIFSAGAMISFDDHEMSPSRISTCTDIREAILMQICTFPKEMDGKFVAEYAIPQMLTTALLNHGFQGLVFPSTKDYSDLTGHHRFSPHHLNVGLFVPYDPVAPLSERLLSDFHAISPRPATDPSPGLGPIRELASSLKDLYNASPNNNNDYIIPIVMMNLHFDYLEKSLISGIPYFETVYGQTELKLFNEMLQYAREGVS